MNHNVICPKYHWSKSKGLSAVSRHKTDILQNKKQKKMAFKVCFGLNWQWSAVLTAKNIFPNKTFIFHYFDYFSILRDSLLIRDSKYAKKSNSQICNLSGI